MYEDDRSYHRIVVGLLIVGALLLSLFGWVLYDLRSQAWTHATDTSLNLATALKRDILRTIETYDLSLRAAMNARLAPELPQLSPKTRHQLLFDGAVEARHMGAVFILDASGDVTEASDELRPPLGNFADRDFFTVQRDGSDVGLYVSKPYLSRRTNNWSIAISRRLTGPDGRFAGVVAGSIGFPYFADLFSKLDLGPEGSIGLFRLDGTALFRTPFLASQIGQDFSKASLFRELQAGHSAPYRDTAQTDGLSKLFTFSIVDGLPLVVTVNMAVSTIFADWYNKVLLTSVAVAILLIIGAVLVHAARAQQIRRLQAERQTKRASEMFQAYFENSPDALFTVNVGADDRLTYESHNRACGLLTGLADGQAIGKEPADVFDPNTAASVERRYRECISSGRTHIYQESRMLSIGRRDWHAVLCPIRDATGRIAVIVGSARDMTSENRRDAELHQAGKMEAVGRLTAGIAHDFNNYLQTITGSLEMLMDDHVTDPEGREFGDIAKKAAASGAQLTHRLLAFSRQQVLQPRRTNVAALLRETRQLVGFSGFGSDIHFKIAVESFTNDVHVDPVQAESCLLNLLFNARDAMPEGGDLVLQARRARPTDGVCGQLSPENIVIISVEDTGAGMDSETRARAFEPFFTTKAFGKGSGLGLSMVQGFCRQSGGDVRILSGGVVGTRIELWLPSMASTTIAGAEASTNIASIGSVTGRILLVEDECDVSLMLAAALVSGGFEVVTVNSGRDALARLNEGHPYDAVLTDHSMPDMSGTEFLTLARAKLVGIPTLMISGSDIGEGLGGGDQIEVCFLRKPILRVDLLTAVREAIGIRTGTLAA